MGIFLDLLNWLVHKANILDNCSHSISSHYSTYMHYYYSIIDTPLSSPQVSEADGYYFDFESNCFPSSDLIIESESESDLIIGSDDNIFNLSVDRFYC